MDSKEKIANKFKRSFPALYHRNFRYFWMGQCVSLMGTWMQRTAQQWLVYTLTKSAFLLGLLGVFQFGPMLLFSLFAGVFVDRYPKKRILIMTQSVLMLQAFALAALVLSGHVRYWHVLVLAAVLGCVNTFDMPTRQSFFVELVGREDLMNAIALNSTIVNIARIVGPAFSGFLMVYTSAGFCFFLNGVSFIAVIIGLIFIKTHAVNIRSSNRNVFGDIKDGINYIVKSDMLSKAVLVMLAVNIFAMNSEVIIPVFAKEVLHRGASEYSMLLSTMGFGALIGALLVASNSKRGPRQSILFGSALFLSVFLMTGGIIHSIFISLIMVMIIGFFGIVFLTNANSTVQLNSSDEYRGRVMSVYTFVFAGTTPFGNLFAGSITEKFGPNMGFLASGIITFIFVLLILLFKSGGSSIKKSVKSSAELDSLR